MSRMKKGIFQALTAYLLWGIFPLYFKLLQSVTPEQILAHRLAWSFLLLLMVVLLRGELGALYRSLTLRRVFIYLAAALLISINWLVYVWTVTTGRVLQSSLGYFINPIVSVLLGALLFSERLRAGQWAAVGVAGLGVLYLTLEYGSLPWPSLVLAITFGLYGVVKKAAPLEALHSLTLETALVFPAAVGYLIWVEAQGRGSFAHTTAQINGLLAISGVVTAIPLLLFSAGARRVPLFLLGLLQYVSPTMQFLLGVFLFHEAFNVHRLIGFAFIWLALLFFSGEGLLWQRRHMRPQPTPTFAEETQ
jgi:chloramphenicol-sensitive protein RarD